MRIYPLVLALSLITLTGDLVGLNVLGTKILVLNSHKAVTDLLEKRGNVYSDRPVFIAVGELMGLNRVRSLYCSLYTTDN